MNTHCPKPSSEQPQALVQNLDSYYDFFPRYYPTLFYSVMPSQVSLIVFRKSFLNYLAWHFLAMNPHLRLFYLQFQTQALDEKVLEPTFGPIFYEDPRGSRTIADIYNEGRRFANPAQFVQNRRHLYDVTRCNGTMFYNRQRVKMPNDNVYQEYLSFINGLRPAKILSQNNKDTVLCDSETEDEDDQMLSFDAIGCVVMWDGGTETENERPDVISEEFNRLNV